MRKRRNTGSPLHILSVRVSCGCTSAQALHEWVAAGQESAILAQMDTRRFSGQKSVTIFVSFDQPSYEEVRLWVQANSRDDVTVIPESLAFGTIKRGTAPGTAVTISFLGGGNWQILGVKTDSNYVQASVREIRRDAGEVSYQLTAAMRADAPPGKWYTDVWLQTNNPMTPRVRVPLTVEIAEGDLRDAGSLMRAMSGIRALFHVAADYRLWARHPREIVDTNVEGTRALMEAALRLPDPALARAISAERRAIKPGSPHARSLFDRASALPAL